MYILLSSIYNLQEVLQDGIFQQGIHQDSANSAVKEFLETFFEVDHTERKATRPPHPARRKVLTHGSGRYIQLSTI